jgi:glyoxylase-like metal-dependent hydrolase (beta-lactamase superfamily II)
MYHQITERVYALGAQGLMFPLRAWVYLVLSPTSRRVLLIDCGARGAARGIARALRAIGRSPADVAAIALTHWHADHTGGLADLLRHTDQPVTVYGSGTDIDIYVAQERRAVWLAPNALLRRGTRIRHSPGPLPTRAGITYQRLGAENAHDALREWGVEAVATPGHSAGHTAYHVVDARAVCCGDALFRLGQWLVTLFLYHDADQMAQSARTLLAMDYDWLLPAHLSPILHPLPAAARGHPEQETPRGARILERMIGFRYYTTIGRA